jgi:hypothetical protein
MSAVARGRRRLHGRLSRPSACVGGGRIRTSGRMRGAPWPPSQTAGPRRVPRTSCSASSTGWCAMPMVRASGSGSSPGGCLGGRGQSRTPETGRTWCSLSLLSAWTGSSRAAGCSVPESSRQSWVWMVMSCHSRPGGRIRSSRWRRRFACRSRGRTDVPSRKTWLWWLVDARSDWGEAVDVVQLDEKNVVFRARVKRAERRLLRRGVAVASWWRESEAASCFQGEKGDYKKTEAC